VDDGSSCLFPCLVPLFLPLSSPISLLSVSSLLSLSGRRQVRKDGKLIAFLSRKAWSLAEQRIRAQRLTWTQAWRRKNKKGKVRPSCLCAECCSNPRFRFLSPSSFYPRALNPDTTPTSTARSINDEYLFKSRIMMTKHLFLRYLSPSPPATILLLLSPP
jgi:ribosomal protein L24E